MPTYFFFQKLPARISTEVLSSSFKVYRTESQQCHNHEQFIHSGIEKVVVVWYCQIQTRGDSMAIVKGVSTKIINATTCTRM